MATLNGQPINTSFEGLIKTNDNEIIGAGEKQITDGLGNASTLSLGTTSASFTGDLDLSAATVTGIPLAGLVAGTGTGSMKSAASLTTAAASANGANSIALGNGAIAVEPSSVAIGNGAQTQNAQTVSVGVNCNAGSAETIAIGSAAAATGLRAISIGSQSDATATGAVALGYFAQATASGATALGDGVTAATANTATVKLLQIANYATMDYADDAAAAIGGIPLGGVYHTTGALKIRIV